LGYPLDKYGVDGDYGRETERAVRQFQKAAQIRQDGIYGEQTHGVLIRFLSGREIENDASAPAAPQRYVRVTGGYVNLRSGPGLEHDVVTVVRENMRLEWLATADSGWHAVRADGMCGWLSPRMSEVVCV
jgi:peptidoglycan hydrolase-like protein with peptidoglycan-binding domain